MFTFKLKGREYQPERITTKQFISGLLHCIGIDTELYRTTRTARDAAWKAHAERLQAELDAERLNGKLLSGLNN